MVRLFLAWTMKMPCSTGSLWMWVDVPISSRCLQGEPIDLRDYAYLRMVLDGPGVVDGVFSPVLAGLGAHVLSFTYSWQRSTAVEFTTSVTLNGSTLFWGQHRVHLGSGQWWFWQHFVRVQRLLPPPCCRTTVWWARMNWGVWPPTRSRRQPSATEFGSFCDRRTVRWR